MTRISETENGFDLLNRDHKRNVIRTFEVDSSLPSLPLPPLNHTLDKYLRSVRPFLTDLEYLTTQKKVENFRNGVGKALQFHLKAKANREKNWLEKWWLDWAYLEWREPIWPYINTAGIIIDPNDLTVALERLKRDGINIQAARTAMAISFYVRFFDELRNQTLPVHKSRSGYFSMAQFRKFFNTCRVPHKNKDNLVNRFKTIDEGDCPTHIVVMYKNRFFNFDTYDRDKNMLEISDFYAQLSFILNQYGAGQDGIGIGALTADRRENWAQIRLFKNREHLLGLSPANLEYLKLIEESLIVVNLDQDDCFTNDDITNLCFLKNPKNRFYDKAFQLVISRNGMVGSNIEHSPFDGMVTTTITSYSIDKTQDVKMETKTFKNRKNDRYLEKPIELEFVYDEKITKEIDSCVKLAETNCSSIEVKILVINEYTKEKLKSFKINPDTVVQMALQLAYYQLHKKPAPTYETATTRAFYHGRTETVRSCSLEAVEWCKEMCNQASLNQRTLLEMFKRACNRHEQLMSEAKRNFGCDRHLLGLMLTSKELNLGLHDIYSDDAWKKSGGGGNFLISSSCVGFVATIGVCAPFCLNGYSAIYSICDSGLLVGLGRYKQSQESHLEKFSQSLRAALNQIEHLITSISKL